MPKDMLIAIGAGILSATAAVAFVGPNPVAFVIVYLAAVPLYAVGLALGQKATAAGVAAGFMFAGLLGGGFAAGVFGMTQALPAWLVVKQMLMRHRGGWETGDGTSGKAEWYPAGEMLGWLALLAAVLLVMLAMLAALDGKGLSVMMTEELGRVFRYVMAGVDEAERATLVGRMAPVFPGVAAASWIIMVVVNGVLAQALVKRMGRNVRPTPQYAALTVPDWVSWPLIGAALLALLGSGELEYLGRNLALVMAVPFFLLGLAVVHTWARRVSFGGLLRFGVYLVILVSGWAAVAVAGIGLAEQWSGLRRRMAPADENTTTDDD